MAFRSTAERGRPREWNNTVLVPTTPSAILRVPPEDRDAALDALVAELTVVAGLR